MKKQKLLLCVFISILMFLISGCGGLKIRASDAMYKSNPVEKIALVAESRVFWPSPSRTEYLLNIEDSKKALEALLAQTKDVFAEKGYEIVYSEPAGIGLHDPKMEGDWIVVENFESIDKKRQVKNGDIVYAYPIIRENQKFKNAVQHVFDQLQIAFRDDQANTLDLTEKTSDLNVIYQVTGGDTICFNRIYGEKFTTARKAGDMATNIGVGLLTGILTGGLVVVTPVKQAQDIVESHFTCVDATTGEVVWQHGLRSIGDPADPNKRYIEGILKPFPAINTPMDNKYKM